MTLTRRELLLIETALETLLTGEYFSCSTVETQNLCNDFRELINKIRVTEDDRVVQIVYPAQLVLSEKKNNAVVAKAKAADLPKQCR
jgi:hypothetical protein